MLRKMFQHSADPSRKNMYYVPLFLACIGAFVLVSAAAAATEPSASPGSLVVAHEDGRVTLRADDADITAVLAALAEQWGVPVSPAKGVSGRISLRLERATPEEALKALCASRALVYERLPGNKGWRIVAALAAGEKQAASDVVFPAAAAQPSASTDGPANASHPEASADSGKGSVSSAPPAGAALPSPPGTGDKPTWKKGELLIKFKSDTAADQRAALHARIGSVVMRRLKISGMERVKLPAGLDENAAIGIYLASGLVETAGKNHLRYPQATPDDPYFSTQWGMTKIGMESAWDIATGSRDIIVAVIDSGVDYTHPDLQGNIWINEAEKNGSPDVDDDKNGYTDDLYGWDFAGYSGEGDGYPMDSYGHGTHVAGIIGATGNNGVGVAGMNWKIRIMPLKVMEDGSSEFTESAIIEAIDYATANGARVVNCSFGGTEFSTSEYDAYNRLRAAGIIAAVAAGNYSDDMDIDTNKLYPACYNLDNILSVANSDRTDAIASSSNYGKTTVDVAAPGTSIYSTEPSTTSTMASVKTPNLATSYPAVAMEFSGLTPDAGITGSLYDCGMGYTDQIPDAVAGQLALIERGNRDGIGFYFSEKVQNARQKGAAGVIIYNNVTPEESPDDHFDTEGGTLQYPSDWPPVVSVTKAIGQDILTGMQNGMLPNATLVNKQSTDAAYGYMTGTSMAAPHVAGLAGLLAGTYPSAGYADIRCAILDHVDRLVSLTEKVASGGRINAFSSLANFSTIPGDLSGNCSVGLEDAIIVLKILAGIAAPLACPLPGCTRDDIDQDGRITAAEGIHILQKIAEIR